MERALRTLIACSLAIIAALLVVGAVSHGIVRHIVQTSPLWIGIVLAFRRSSVSKWTLLPCFVFWLLIMIAIWLFLLGWAHIVSGTFSPTEITMTVIVGLAAMVGTVRSASIKSGVHLWPAATTVLLVAILQLAAFRLSLLPEIAHR